MKINPEDSPSGGKRKRVPAPWNWLDDRPDFEEPPPMSAALRLAFDDVSKAAGAKMDEFQRKGLLK